MIHICHSKVPLLGTILSINSETCCLWILSGYLSWIWNMTYSDLISIINEQIVLLFPPAWEPCFSPFCQFLEFLVFIILAFWWAEQKHIVNFIYIYGIVRRLNMFSLLSNQEKVDSNVNTHTLWHTKLLMETWKVQACHIQELLLGTILQENSETLVYNFTGYTSISLMFTSHTWSNHLGLSICPRSQDITHASPWWI